MRAYVGKNELCERREKVTLCRRFMPFQQLRFRDFGSHTEHVVWEPFLSGR